MSDAGFVALLAKGSVYPRAKPAEFRQAICARLSGNSRLGQNSPRPASAEGSDRKKFSQIRRGVSPSDGKRDRQRLDRASRVHAYAVSRHENGKRQNTGALQNVAAYPNSIFSLAFWSAAVLRRFSPPAKLLLRRAFPVAEHVDPA